MAGHMDAPAKPFARTEGQMAKHTRAIQLRTRVSGSTRKSAIADRKGAEHKGKDATSQNKAAKLTHKAGKAADKASWFATPVSKAPSHLSAVFNLNKIDPAIKKSPTRLKDWLD